MCGRYAFAYDQEEFTARFQISNNLELHSSFNASPGMVLPVVTHNSPNMVELMHWGLIPPWAKDIRIGYKKINARAESILERPAYRKPFMTQRCLVPFSAFYEWKKEGKDKVPFLFQDKAQQYLSFAGLYEEETKSYTMITTAANKLMGGIHDRMPVILSPDQEAIWLDKESKVEELLELLDGYESTTFDHVQVEPPTSQGHLPKIVSKKS
jgi:putative SOS response-associated peptidase YedK